MVEMIKGARVMSRLKQLALVLIATTLAGTAALAGTGNTGSLSIGTTVATQGDTGVAVTISATTATNDIGGAPNISAMTFSINLSSTLCGNLSNLAVVAAGRTTGTPEISGINCGGGQIMFNLSDAGGATVLPDGSGAIMTWTFDVSGSTPPGVFPLTVSDQFAASGPVTVALTTSAGQLTIEGVAVPTSTPEDTATPEATATNTVAPTNTTPPEPTDTPTEGPTPTNTSSPTITNTPLPTATPTNTGTNTQTPTNTASPTATNTAPPSATPTNTPIPTPRITSGASFGSSVVSGTGAANANIEIRTSPGGEVLGSATAGANGSFTVFLNRALEGGDAIQAFDTTNGLAGAVIQINAPPAPIPAVDPIGAALLIVLMAGGLAWRLRRS
jgi:hypothetical protein